MQNNNETHVVDLLIESAVENLTVFNESVSNDLTFGKLFPITNHYKCMLLYNSGKNDLAFNLSWKIVRLRLEVITNAAVNLMHVPEFLRLMDNDIVSMIGLTVLFNRYIWRGDWNRDRFLNPTVLMIYIAGRCLLKLRLPYPEIMICVKYASQLLKKLIPEWYILDRLALTYIKDQLINYQHPIFTS